MLPIIEQPTFEVTIPSSKRKIHFRPFVVKEEKVLLIAQEGGAGDVIRAIKDVMKACIQEKDVEIDQLTTFDLEYLFLRLRAKSVNNIAKITYEDHEDGKARDFEIDLEEIEVEFDETNEMKIPIANGVGIMMKYPSAAITDQLVEIENDTDMMMYFITNSIDYIYENDTLHPANEQPPEELEAFLDALPIECFEKIKQFFATLPRLYHKIEYTNDMGTKRVIELKNLRDFFTWG